MSALSGFIEVELPGNTPEASRAAFLRVKETLTRIGIESKKGKTLYQSCHIFHKRSKYYLVHFKQMFALDGRPSTLEPADMARTAAIALLLEDWNLLRVKDPESVEAIADLSGTKIIKFEDKDQWNLQQKYKMGKRD